MARFALEWWWAGHRGVLEDVTARWSARGYALIGRGVESLRKVTIQAVLPLDVPALSGLYGLRSGSARLTCDGRPLLTGRMRIAHGVPRNGSTPVEIEVSDDQREERGVFPASGAAPPVRSPDDVVGQELWRVYVGEGFDDDPYWARRVPDSVSWAYSDRWTQVAVPVLRSDSEEFDNIPAPSQGQALPYPIGAPGSATAPGSPAWYINEGDIPEPARLIIADRAVEASTVTIFGPEDATNPDRLTSVANVPVYVAQRGTDGGSYSYVLLSDVTTAPSTVINHAEGHYYVSWAHGRASPGGAGDVALSVIAASSLSFDLEAWQAVAPVLNRYELAGFMDDQPPAWEWFASAILPMLPVAVVGGPRGMRPLLSPWIDDTPVDPPLLVDGESIVIADFVREREGGGASSVVLEYAFRPDSGGYDASHTADATTAQVVGNDTGVERMQTAFVWSPSTAALVASDALRLRTSRNRTIRAQVYDYDLHGPGGAMELYEGRVVRVLSAALGSTPRLGAVSELEIDGESMIVAIDLRDDPARGD